MSRGDCVDSGRRTLPWELAPSLGLACVLALVPALVLVFVLALESAIFKGLLPPLSRPFLRKVMLILDVSVLKESVVEGCTPLLELFGDRKSGLETAVTIVMRRKTI